MLLFQVHAWLSVPLQEPFYKISSIDSVHDKSRDEPIIPAYRPI